MSMPVVAFDPLIARVCMCLYVYTSMRRHKSDCVSAHASECVCPRLVSVEVLVACTHIVRYSSHALTL